MIRLKSALLVLILIVISICTIGINAKDIFLNNKQEKMQDEISQQALFDAEITFNVLTGEGCACTPIPGAKISAYSGEGNTSNVTDEDGLCILTLVILGEYNIIIEADGYQMIDFEFNVLDDQTFTFHMFEKRESSQSIVSSQYGLNTKKLTN
jgi:hypothetical protein